MVIFSKDSRSKRIRKIFLIYLYSNIQLFVKKEFQWSQNNLNSLNICYMFACSFHLLNLIDQTNVCEYMYFFFNFPNAIKKQTFVQIPRIITHLTPKWNYYRFTFNSNEKACIQHSWNPKDAIWFQQHKNNFVGLFTKERKKTTTLNKHFTSMNIDHE